MLDLALLCFLPLLGGFLFVRGFLLTRYSTAREETARVYYRAAMFGAVLATVGLLAHNELRRAVPAYHALALQTETNIVTPLLAKPAAPAPAVATPSAPAAEVAAARVRAWIFWACTWGFLLGAATPVFNALTRILLWLVNALAIGAVALMRQFGWRPRGPLLSPIERLNRRAITDELERLLYEAMLRADSVQVSLDNQKVYVGIVTSIDPVGPAKHFTLQPLMSGGRNGDDRDVVYTSFYDKVIQAVQQAAPAQGEALLRRMALVVPIARVVTASGFDFDAFKRFSLARIKPKLRFKLQSNGQRVLQPQPKPSSAGA